MDVQKRDAGYFGRMLRMETKAKEEVYGYGRTQQRKMQRTRKR